MPIVDIVGMAAAVAGRLSFSAKNGPSRQGRIKERTAGGAKRKTLGVVSLEGSRVLGESWSVTQ